MNLWTLNFAESFAPTLSVVEIVLHGTLIYLGLCLIRRIFPKPQAGTIAISELLFVVIIGDIAADALSHETKSLMDFVLILLTVVLLGYGLNWLTLRSRRSAGMRHDKPHVASVASSRSMSARMRDRVTREPEGEEAARRRRRRLAEELLARAHAID